MGVIGYQVTLSEGNKIANHPYKETLVPHLVATLIFLSQNYSYYIRGDRSPLNGIHIFSTRGGSIHLNVFVSSIFQLDVELK